MRNDRFVILLTRLHMDFEVNSDFIPTGSKVLE